MTKIFTKIHILSNIAGKPSKYYIQNGHGGHFESGHRVKSSLTHQNSIIYEFLVLNNQQNHILSSILSQLITTNIFKIAAAAILNSGRKINYSLNHQNNINYEFPALKTPKKIFLAALLAN